MNTIPIAKLSSGQTEEVGKSGWAASDQGNGDTAHHSRAVNTLLQQLGRANKGMRGIQSVV